MDRHALFEQLSGLYTLDNLNRISSWIISAFKSGRSDLLADLAAYVPQAASSSGTDQKRFTRLMMCYHPDRHASIMQSIRNAYDRNQTDLLRGHLHIASALHFIRARASESHGQRTPPTPPKEPSAPRPMHPVDGKSRNFVSALKQKEYGNLNVVYHDVDLAGMEGDLELSGYGIADLTGLELCTNLTGLDVSGNCIHDIWALSALTLIEELDLSRNRIRTIQALESLPYLRIVDLSDNEIEDVRPLYDLEHLEFVNLISNPIHEEALRPLRRRGVVVVI